MTHDPVLTDRGRGGATEREREEACKQKQRPNAGARPKGFGGDTHRNVEWKAEFLACMRLMVDDRIESWAKEGQTQKENVEMDAIDLDLGIDAGHVNKFSSLFLSELTCVFAVSYYTLSERSRRQRARGIEVGRETL